MCNESLFQQTNEFEAIINLFVREQENKEAILTQRTKKRNQQNADVIRGELSA